MDMYDAIESIWEEMNDADVETDNPVFIEGLDEWYDACMEGWYSDSMEMDSDIVIKYVEWSEEGEVVEYEDEQGNILEYTEEFWKRRVVFSNDTIEEYMTTVTVRLNEGNKTYHYGRGA